MSGSQYDRRAAATGAQLTPARIWKAAKACSAFHWLKVSGLLITLTIASAGWSEAQARSPRKEAPKRPIHGPNYHPPYAAIVVDDKSGFVLH